MEKTVSFNLYTEDNGFVNVSTDEELLDEPLNSNERLAIIRELVKDSINVLMTEVDETSTQEEVNKELQKVAAYREELLHNIVNLIYGVPEINLGKEPTVREYSLIVYEPIINPLNNEPTLTVCDSIHSENLDIEDPIKAGMTNYMDVALALLYNNIPKKDVIELMRDSFKMCEQAVLQLINEYK